MTHAGRIRTGIGSYARNLIAALESSFGVRVSTLSATRPFDGRADAVSKASRAAHQVLWTQFGLRRQLCRLRPDILHAPAFVSSLVAPCPVVVTIHDMGHARFPRHYETPWLLYMRALVPLVARRAQAIITDSGHARQDVQQLLRLPPEKVHVIYPGIDHSRFRPLDVRDLTHVAARYSLDRPFVLYVGNLAARKNVPTLLRAVYRLKKSGFWRDRRVVLAGSASPGLPGYAEVLAAIKKLGLQQEAILLGYVPDDDLPAIYNLAEAVALPSLHEGFGLPIVEAMACGRPVIASNCSSLPEVAGDAALLVDPRDDEAWAEALSRVLTDEGFRESMVERGLARAREFNWEKSAGETLRVYRGVVDGGAAQSALEEAA
jgi:glycosyltransferase involved in cell wall biosynthesis